MLTLSVLKIAAADSTLFEHLVNQTGLQIVGARNDDPLESTVQSEAIEAMASTITESIYDRVQLSPQHKAVKQLAESLGYIVAVSEGLDQQPGTDYNPIKGQLRHPEEKEEEPTAPEEGGEEGPPQ